MPLPVYHEILAHLLRRVELNAVVLRNFRSKSLTPLRAEALWWARARLGGIAAHTPWKDMKHGSEPYPRGRGYSTKASG